MGRYIKNKTWKALLAKSGNQCAFPGCNCEIVDKENIMIGQAAHIEADEKGGPRYNPNQTDEERNGYDNLIYLCPTHHTIVDKKEKEYTVEILKKMKAEHEYKFRNDICNFDYSKIYEANLELKQFLEKVEEKNNQNESELKIEINKDTNFEELAKEIYENVDFVERTSNEILQFSEELNDKIIEQLKKLGYDATKWESIPYYENPFFNPFWETLVLGYNNVVKTTRLRMMQMEILYYTEYLKYNKDPESDERLKKVKEKLMDLSGELMYID